MKTNQLMKRDFNGTQITQRTKDSFFNATELLSVYNKESIVKKVLPEFWSNKATKDFIEVLENDINLNMGNSLYLKTHESTRGKYGATYMHPYLFVKFAMWLSPEFELAIIKWVYDNLIETRNQAGDYYKEMCDCIQNNYLALKGEKPNPFVFVNEAKFLNQLCYNSSEVGKRNELSEIELKLLNELQKLNIKLIKGYHSNQERKQILNQHAINFKLINL
jgi:hypothetical protein